MNWSDKQTNSTPGEDGFDLVALVSSHLVRGVTWPEKFANH